MRWRLVTISTYASWLPGDERGFRAKQHKIHSSGDYKHRPPKGEHAGLLRYAQSISGRPVFIPRRCRETVGKAILRKLRKLGYRVLSLSVCGMHAHFLVELPDDLRAIRHIIGQCKTVASHGVRNVLPGRVWAGGGDFQPVDDRRHHHNAYQYPFKQKHAWAWCYKRGVVKTPHDP
jgi:REP element-mobilizing transposase RayT